MSEPESDFVSGLDEPARYNAIVKGRPMNATEAEVDTKALLAQIDHARGVLLWTDANGVHITASEVVDAALVAAKAALSTLQVQTSEAVLLDAAEALDNRAKFLATADELDRPEEIDSAVIVMRGVASKLRSLSSERREGP